MKYRVGDKVRIRSDLQIYCQYGNYIFFQGKYRGCNAIIIKVDDLYKDYRLDIDNGEWCWTDEMLESYTMTNH